MKCVAILLLAVTAAMGQTAIASIQGAILDVRTPKPLPAALVIAAHCAGEHQWPINKL